MWLLRKLWLFILSRFWSKDLIVQRFVIPADAGRISTAELVKRIFLFCEVYSGKVMYPYQEQFSKRVIRSVLENDGAEITALFSRQAGKSETIALTTGGLLIILPKLANMPMFAGDVRLQMFVNGFTVGIFAPSQRQAQITYGRIKARIQSDTAQEVLNDPDFRLMFTTSNGQTVALTNGSFCTAISASDGSSIEGESFMLIICEECQDISNYKIQKSIHPMGAAYNASIVKIGTATTFKGDFYDAIQRNKKEQEVKTTHIRNHFEYDWTVAAKYNPKYAKYVEGEKKKLGENSDAFQMSYCLKWIIERSMFIDVVKLERENSEPMFERSMYDKSATHVAGIDVGGKADSTVITIVEVDWDMPVVLDVMHDIETGEDIVYMAYNTYIKDWYEIEKVPDYEEQFALIMDYLSHFKLARVVCDATREASLAHRLRANLRCEVIPYVFSLKSKSELYKYLTAEVSTGRARIPGGEQTITTREYKRFLEQMGGLQQGYSGAHLMVSHGSEINDHDDYCDSWALAVWGCSTSGEPDNTETQKNQFTARTQRESKSIKGRNSVTARRR